MRNEVIKRVEQLGRNDNIPESLVATDKHVEEFSNDLLKEDIVDEDLSY